MSTQNVFAIVLAAGQARRFGATKQLQMYEGTPLVARAVRLAEGVCGPRSVLVTGNDWEAVAAACAPLQGYLVHNAEFADGLSTSIACGVRSVAAAADAVLLMLADQPLITRDHLQDLLSTWQAAPDAIVASSFANKSGPPIVFPRRDYAALQALQGDRGAQSVIESAMDRVLRVEFAGAALDIDRPEDLPAAY